MGENMLTVGKAKSVDRPAVLALTLSAYTEYERELPNDGWKVYSDNIRRVILDDPSVTILVGRDNGILKGSVIFCEPGAGGLDNPFPEMRLLAVPEEFRNQGIAGVLIDECERLAVGYGVLTLHTTRMMQTAKAMYERRGYTRFPDIDF